MISVSLYACCFMPQWVKHCAGACKNSRLYLDAIQTEAPALRTREETTEDRHCLRNQVLRDVKEDAGCLSEQCAGVAEGGLEICGDAIELG